MPDVLYIDDEKDLLDLGKIFLEQSGDLHVDTTISVTEALDKLKHRHYDGIISDYQMPRMNGIEVLRYIRSHYKDLPFILFTGKGREEVVIEALNSGADFYIQKGGDPKSQFVELEHKIKNAINRRRIHDELRLSQQQMKNLINFLPDATFAIDKDSRVIAWNRTIEEMTGMPKDAILGNTSYAVALSENEKPLLIDLVMNRDKEIQKYYPETVKKGDRYISEIWNPTMNQGNGAHLWLAASPLYDVSGNVIGAIEAIRDISARKEAEEKLMRTNEDLHAAYEQLTAAEEELRQNYDELTKSEQLLRLTEERYRSVVEDQTEFICRFSPEGKLTFVNDAYCRYFSLDKNACIGTHHTVVIPLEDQQRVKQYLAALTPDHPVAVIEHRLIMPTGEIRWQRWSDRAIFDPAGRILEYQSVGRDTTDKKDAEEKLMHINDDLQAAYEQLTATEEELRQNYDELTRSELVLRLTEERYRNVVEDQTEFICRFSPDGKLTFVNGAYCRYFALDKDACIGTHHTVVIPPEDQPLVKQHLAALTPDHPVAVIEHRLIMPSGEIRWQRWSDRAIFDPAGRILEYQSVGRDTTDKKEAEEKLMRINEDLQAAYEQLTATEEELRQNYDELTKSEQLLRLTEERYRNVVEDQTEFICRFSPNGKLTFVNGAYCRYFSLDKDACIGKHHTVVIPPEDQPRVKQHLAALTPDHPVAVIDHRLIMPSGEIRWQRWSDRAIFDPAGRILEYQSVGRDITETKRMKSALQESNKKLNLLSSITRHDILNQLMALKGYLELSENVLENPQKISEFIKKEQQIASTIEEQITFTRHYQDMGVKTPLWQNVHVSVLTVCQDDGFSKIVIDPLLKSVEIFVDPLLKTVFHNLFENAAMHGGNVTRILVSGQNTPDGFALTIEDDGYGIPLADKEMIFIRGFGRHTGLGLFLAREVLAITGLTIKETGKPGQGARFTIQIPKGMYRQTGV
ncbi:MAG: PAS domain S-box protein [Methanoregula sp.]|nr:PAS domain S-box protein [Methanoregula sp.]